MRTEISALFSLQSAVQRPVRRAHIGNGVHIERLYGDWLDVVRVQCPKVEAREQIEPLNHYTHRLFYELNPGESESAYPNPPTPAEKQLILRAIVLSRIVKPTSIAYDGTWVKSHYPATRPVSHYSDPIIRGSNLAFVIPKDEDWNTITEADALVMAELWDSLQFFLDDANVRQYRRIVRAINYHEWAYSIWLPMLSHMIVHAALESMICVSKKENKAQVTQRLRQLVSFPITPQQAEDIYRTCCDFKHAAAAMFTQAPTSTGALTPIDQRRADAVILLRRAVRDLLTREFRDRTFADMLADPNLLRQQHPVYDRKGNLVQ
jgi:hypothetical protein